jgi:cupin fold WbuC family metalloprotein
LASFYFIFILNLGIIKKMNQIFSKLDETKLICAFVKKNQINNYRLDLSPPEEFLQVCARKLDIEVKVSPHKHTFIERQSDITQECWIILDGKLKAEIFDLDGTFLQDIILESGDCITLYRGGHSLECLAENTLFYELKNGPYYGVEIDKKAI